jgi:hypothetical protein
MSRFAAYALGFTIICNPICAQSDPIFCDSLASALGHLKKEFNDIKADRTVGYFRDNTGWATPFRLAGSNFCSITDTPSLVCNYKGGNYILLVGLVRSCLDPRLWNEKTITRGRRINPGSDVNPDKSTTFVQDGTGAQIGIWGALEFDSTTIEISNY